MLFFYVWIASLIKVLDLLVSFQCAAVVVYMGSCACADVPVQYQQHSKSISG
jgi:hypothetical protein